jgi:hypothetical protein
MDTADLHLHQDLGTHLGGRPDLGVRPGESNPAGMLCLVLVLFAVIVPIAALALVWWLV